MMKNNFVYVLLLFVFTCLFQACDESVTYSEMQEKERKAVKEFIKEKGINIISYEDFIANDSVTDVTKNEFVEIDGVYMQIVNNPKGNVDARRIADGETRNILVRYYEYNIQDGDTISGNIFAGEADEMLVTNTSGTYSATFTSGVMVGVYGNAVPTGWLIPFTYLYFTRYQSQLAKVNLIVPHKHGTVTATTYVYPCLYQITFQPENLYEYD